MLPFYNTNFKQKTGDLKKKRSLHRRPSIFCNLQGDLKKKQTKLVIVPHQTLRLHKKKFQNETLFHACENEKTPKLNAVSPL